MARGGSTGTQQPLLTLPGFADAGLSPIRRQYLDLKRRCPDAILFFRLGDFYETFEEDATTIARVLDVALTSREMGRGERLPMAGVPAAAADGYIARLIAQGFHVAIADQVGEVPRTGLVRREIVRIVTPGTIMEEDLLGGHGNNFLAAVCPEREGCGLAYVDVTTGEIDATEIHGPTWPDVLAAELVRVGPSEYLLPEDQAEGPVQQALPPDVHLTRRGADLFNTATAARAFERRFQTPLDSAGFEDAPLALKAIGALLAYIQETRPSALETLRLPHRYAPGGTMLLDRATRANLDLLEGSGRTGLSLVAVLDHTRTPMGARALRAWVGQPLLDPTAICERLDGVEHFFDHAPLRARLGSTLQNLPDLERLAVRAGQQILAPRECLALASALERVADVQAHLGTSAEPAALPPLLAAALAHLDPLPAVVADVRATIAEGATIFGEGVVKTGVSANLDEQRTLGGDARQWIASLEKRERERAAVKSARVGYNKVFGYYLEVSQAACAQPTDHYQRQATGAATIGEHLERLGWTRKQTLANAERFITPELKDLEARIAHAHEEALRLERAIYSDLLQRLALVAHAVGRTAQALARIDALLGLAEAAVRGAYTRPQVDDGPHLAIVQGRHPVVEHSLPRGAFVPNDTHLDPDRRILLLTGPNMAGKSTYLRQVACIVLMAQVGSFVPAESAHVGVVDRIFTRIGAQDDIAAGRSTFMVEMTEAAAILRAATRHSLVVLDELGRGTSTFDGLAIAQSIVEDLHAEDRPNGAPKVIVATHYHELTALADRLPAVRNYRVDVLERGNDVVFLHALVEGGADRSFGVHVARLAGVPDRVTQRAWQVLRSLEATAPPARAPSPTTPDSSPSPAPCPVCAELCRLDVLNLSPLQAQSELHRLHQLAQPATAG